MAPGPARCEYSHDYVYIVIPNMMTISLVFIGCFLETDHAIHFQVFLCDLSVTLVRYLHFGEYQ